MTLPAFATERASYRSVSAARAARSAANQSHAAAAAVDRRDRQDRRTAGRYKDVAAHITPAASEM